MSKMFKLKLKKFPKRFGLGSTLWEMCQSKQKKKVYQTIYCPNYVDYIDFPWDGFPS